MIFWIIGTALFLDQFSKLCILETMDLGESVPVFGSFFKLTYIQNPGMVFGLRLGGPYISIFLAAFALILVVILLWQLPKTEHLTTAGLALVLGGAVGNLVDRLRYGAVIDFLDFGFGDFRWWVFNLADVWVTTGTGLMILSYNFWKEERKGYGNESSPC